MPDLSPFGATIDAAVSASVAVVAGFRAIAASSACTTMAAATGCPAANAAAFSTAATCRRFFDALRLRSRCDPSLEGTCEPPFPPYTSAPTKRATRATGTSCLYSRVNSAHRGDVEKYAYRINRNRSNRCVRDLSNTFKGNVCTEKLRSRTCTRGAAAPVLQLLRSPQFQRKQRVFLDPVSNHHVFIPAAANANIIFQTFYTATARSEIHASPARKDRRSTVEEESCSSEARVVSGRADTIRRSCVSSSNSDGNSSSLSNGSSTTSNSHISSVSQEDSLTEDPEGAFTRNGEGNSTSDGNHENVSFEDRKNRAIAFRPSPVELQENERSQTEKKLSSSTQLLHPRADETVQTAVSSLSTEAANATSRRQWDVHAAALRKALQRAEFVSVDVELTGLHIRNEKFIGVDRCYEAHCEGARAFMPIQLGLCAARRAGPKHPHRWILTPASIYIFPVDSRIFQASTATLSFLRESGLDFNEWIEHGVPYMRAQEEREKRQALEARIEELEQLRSRAVEESNSGANLTEREVPPQVFPYELATVEDKQLADTVRSAIQSWLASGSKQPLHLPVDNPLQRLLLHSLVASEFPSLSSHSARAGDQRVLAVYQSEGEVYAEQLRALKEEVARLEQLRGVRQILDDIAERRLVLVGHNCFYDLLHLYQTLYGDLPESVTSFKSSWTQTFPYTFDTKLIAETHEVLASLQPPATLKGLCTFMATINAASRDHDPRCAQQMSERSRRDNSHSGGPLALEIQLERLPGTRWSLPTPVQSLSAAAADVMTADAPEIPSLVSNGRSGHLERNTKLARVAELQVQARSQCANVTQNPRQRDAVKETKTGTHTAATDEEDYSHDAGYDSLMTSVVYLLQLAQVLPYHGLRWENVSFGRGRFIEEMRDEASSSLSVKPRELRMRNTQNEMNTEKTHSVTEFFSFFLNKIRLSRTQPACVNLGGKDEQLVQQKRLLFMRNHPATWKKWEIMKIWSPVWVDVQMVDESSSWLVARDEEDAQNIWTIYQMMKNPQFELLNYDQYRAVQRQGSPQQQQ